MTIQNSALYNKTSVKMIDVALDFFNKGYLPCPIVKGQKNPSTKIKEWFASISEQQIEQHWRRHPEDDLALYCSDGLIVLDADSPESKEAIEMLEAKHQLYSNLKVGTKKGLHCYYRTAVGLKIKQAGHSTDQYPDRIDIRCGNSYIIAPPSTDKELLVPEMVSFDQLVELTPSFIEDLLRRNGTNPALDLECPPIGRMEISSNLALKDDNLSEIQALIAHLDPDMGYDEWRNVLMAIHYETNGSREGLAIADKWSGSGSKYKGYAEIKLKWSSFSSRTDS